MKKKKIVYCVILFILIISCLIVQSQAWGLTELKAQMNPATKTDPTVDSGKLGLIVACFKTLQYIGTGISLIVVMKLGISYMMSSVEEKAEVKKRATPILIGTILIVATVNILGFVSKIISDSFK